MIACTLVLLPALRCSALDSNGRSEERVDEAASETSCGAVRNGDLRCMAMTTVRLTE
jgi:hypothetical protein